MAIKDLNKHRKHFDVGQMNKRITFQVRSDTPDGGGGIIPAWRDDLTVWARVEQINGNQLLPFAGHSQTNDRIRFTIRYRQTLDEMPPTLLSKHRIVYAQRAYKIRAPNRVNEEKYYLSYECDGNSWEPV